MQHNICHFITFRKDLNTLHTIHFVLETEPQLSTRLKLESVYKMYYVCQGQGNLHTPGRITSLRQGDLFFTFPGSPFALESCENFSYMYISFVGIRGNRIMESLGIKNDNFYFPDATTVQPFWSQAMHADSRVADMMSEAILLYTFACLGDRLLQKNVPQRQSQSTDQIKRYIDEHYTDQDFSLEKISANLSYNKKYISSIFKKNLGTSVIEYLNTIRIQNACTMIQQGFTSVTDIAERCGYADAQYFSRVFRSQMGIPPTQYIRELQKDTANS